MPPPPDDLTVQVILDAKGDQLRFWIDRAYSDARALGGYMKNPLTKGGKVGDLRERLAGYYGLDLCSTSKPDAAIISKAPLDAVNREIQRKQWAHLRNLGKEWELSVSKGVPFILCAHKSSG
jgi:hypothetical protein